MTNNVPVNAMMDDKDIITDLALDWIEEQEQQYNNPSKEKQVDTQKEIGKVPLNITFEQLVHALYNAIQYRGLDFTYQGECKYSLDGGDHGACVFGVAIIDSLGLKYENNWEGNISSLVDKLGIKVTNEQRVWLSKIQNSQDQHQPYSYAAVLYNLGVEMWGFGPAFEADEINATEYRRNQAIDNLKRELQRVQHKLTVAEGSVDKLHLSRVDNEGNIDDLVAF